jgi:uncharacterized coiled-coil DUF342 family protein
MKKGFEAINEIRSVFDDVYEKNNKLSSQIELNESKILELKNELDDKSKIIDELKEKYNILKMTKKLETPSLNVKEDNKELKLKINEMLREIDKCMALLNS